jgi:hypothetical protein
MRKTGYRKTGRNSETLAAGKRFRLPVQAGWNPLLAQEAFDQKAGLAGERAGACGTRKRTFALVGDLMNLHAPGFGMFHREGKPAFPVVHPVVGTVLLLGIGDRLGKAPNFFLQVLSDPGGMQTHMMLSDPGDHGFGSNYW